MALNTKRKIFDELQSICESDNIEQMTQYLCDYFTTDELVGLVEHIREEKGL
jgi:hypothetical protein